MQGVKYTVTSLLKKKTNPHFAMVKVFRISLTWQLQNRIAVSLPRYTQSLPSLFQIRSEKGITTKKQCYHLSS